MYEYKTVAMPACMGYRGKDTLGEAIADFVELKINEMAKDGWEYYRTDVYTIAEVLGCLGSLLGWQPKIGTYNVLVFRREVLN